MKRHRVLLMFAALMGLALWVSAAERRFSVPSGLNLTSPAAVMEAANASYERKDYLVAIVLYKKLLQLMPDDYLSTTRISAMSQQVAGLEGSLSGSQKARYEEFVASVLKPEELKRVPAWRSAMASLATENPEMAISYANSILAILPSDSAARAFLDGQGESYLKRGDRLLMEGDLPGANEMYMKFYAADPARAKERLDKVKSITQAHDKLKAALSGGSETDIRSSANILSGQFPKDPLLAEASRTLGRYQQLQRLRGSRVPLFMRVEVCDYRGLTITFNSGRSIYLKGKSAWKSPGAKVYFITVPDFCGGTVSIKYQCWLKNNLGRAVGGYKDDEERSITIPNVPGEGWLSISCGGTYDAWGRAEWKLYSEADPRQYGADEEIAENCGCSCY